MAELGCDLAQGYLFSRPVDAESILAIITGESQFDGASAPAALEGTSAVAELTTA